MGILQDHHYPRGYRKVSISKMEDILSQKRRKRQNDFKFMAFLTFLLVLLFHHPQYRSSHFLKAIARFSR